MAVNVVIRKDPESGMSLDVREPHPWEHRYPEQVRAGQVEEEFIERYVEAVSAWDQMQRELLQVFDRLAQETGEAK